MSLLYGGSKAALEANSAVMAKDLIETGVTGVTVNVLVPGGMADTAMIPVSSNIDRRKLISPQKMVAPCVWLASDASAGVSGKRFVAVRWDENLPDNVAAQNACDPIAWSSLGPQAVTPQ